MKEFFEKPNEKILRDCEMFVKENQNSKSNYDVYSNALVKYYDLSKSLLESRKDFDNAIAEEADNYISMVKVGDNLSDNAAIQLDSRLKIDLNARETLKQLGKIIDNYSVGYINIFHKKG